MKSKKCVKDEQGALPCKYCRTKGRIVYPQVRCDDDLWYTICPKCCHYDTYDFIGINRHRTIENWNNAMK